MRSVEQENDDRLRLLGPIFRARYAAGNGISSRDLYQPRESGLLLELSRGPFQLREASPIDQLDFVVVCARAPWNMVCLRSALAYWDLSDENLSRIDLAVRSGSHRPAYRLPADPEPRLRHADLRARATRRVGQSIGFSITNPERTVVDCFRLRPRIGPDLAANGLRRYLQRPRAQPGRVLELFHELRARTPIRQAMWVLEA